MAGSLMAPDAGRDESLGIAALEAVDFSPTRALRSIWHDSPDHVAALNRPLLERVVRSLFDGTAPDRPGNPRGLVLVGQPGIGKTHLLGALRHDVWERGGWFVLLHLLSVGEFWKTAILGYVSALDAPMPGGRSQGEVLLDRIAATFLLEPELLAGLRASRRDACATGAMGVLAMARRANVALAREHRDTVLAFALLQAGDPELQDLARSWLTGVDIGDVAGTSLGLHAAQAEPQRGVAGLSWLMSLGGPTLCAVDQIDAIVSVAHAEAVADPEGEAAQNRARAVIDGLAGGLMEIFDVSHRTMTVLSTLQASWRILESRALASAPARFQPEVRVPLIGDAAIALRLVELRLAAPYARAGFAPPYPTWPFRPEAFAATSQFTPRQLLQLCEQHRDACLAERKVTELMEFGAAAAPDSAAPISVAPVSVAPVSVAPPRGADIEARYDALRGEPLRPSADETAAEEGLAALIAAALLAFARQTADTGARAARVDTDTPGLHAVLRIGDAAEGESEHLHCFRVIVQAHHLAVQRRLRDAITGSGIDRALPFRTLTVIRRGPWPTGAKTEALVGEFDKLRGRKLFPDDDDQRRFTALRTLLAEKPPGLDSWLRQRRPLDESGFFQALGLAEAPPVPAREPAPMAPPAEVAPAPAPPATSPQAPRAEAIRQVDGIPLGVRPADREPVVLPLTLLPRHVAVIAGSGSGKTVLLRRIIEEAALLGVPSIVIDPNNDLVRLTEPWPGLPDGFSAEDVAKAERFQREADVVIWMPGRARGNPLVFAPLPDFAALDGDQDERDAAIGAAAAALQPLYASTGQLGRQRRGVVMDALRHLARSVTGRLEDLITLLRDLPPDVSRIDRAPKLAADVANDLDAARSLNPLLDGTGTPTDPRVLLSGADGRTRVSVVNLAGLPNEEARQDFVGRLLMTLFGYIRRYPAGPDRPVLGLLVMDEAQNFAPSSAMTPSRLAATALARQARKYGLGMVFATQAPRAVDNAIIGNCTTQIFGRMNSPVALDVVRELMAARGGAADDLGRLDSGTFYVTTEGLQRPQKFRAPLCLTHHPNNPPSEEEVLVLAARTRVPAG